MISEICAARQISFAKTKSDAVAKIDGTFRVLRRAPPARRRAAAAAPSRAGRGARSAEPPRGSAVSGGWGLGSVKGLGVRQDQRGQAPRGLGVCQERRGQDSRGLGVRQ